MNKKYDHIFFDLDRTLWHFDENSKKVLEAIYIHFKLEKWISNSVDFVEKHQEVNELLWNAYRDGKITKQELRLKRFEKTLNYFSIDDVELSADMESYYLSECPTQTVLFPYSYEVLVYLSKKYRLHIITNGFEESQVIKLNNSKINHFFEVIIFSECVGVRKPHPYIFKKAFRMADAKNTNSLMIGDNWYADIYGAQRVKMDSIYFNPNKNRHNHKVTTEISCLSELYKLL